MCVDDPLVLFTGFASENTQTRTHRTHSLSNASRIADVSPYITLPLHVRFLKRQGGGLVTSIFHKQDCSTFLRLQTLLVAELNLFLEGLLYLTMVKLSSKLNLAKQVRQISPHSAPLEQVQWTRSWRGFVRKSSEGLGDHCALRTFYRVLLAVPGKGVTRCCAACAYYNSHMRPNRGVEESCSTTAGLLEINASLGSDAVALQVQLLEGSLLTLNKGLNRRV